MSLIRNYIDRSLGMLMKDTFVFMAEIVWVGCPNQITGNTTHYLFTAPFVSAQDLLSWDTPQIQMQRELVLGILKHFRSFGIFCAFSKSDSLTNRDPGLSSGFNLPKITRLLDNGSKTPEDLIAGPEIRNGSRHTFRTRDKDMTDKWPFTAIQSPSL